MRYFDLYSCALVTLNKFNDWRNNRLVFVLKTVGDIKTSCRCNFTTYGFFISGLKHKLYDIFGNLF